MTTAAYRVVDVAALLPVLALLAVWIGTVQPDPSVGEYPGTTELEDDYDRHLGQHVEVGGLVIDIGPVTIVIEDGTGEPHTLTVTDLDVLPAIDHLLVLKPPLRLEGHSPSLASGIGGVRTATSCRW